MTDFPQFPVAPPAFDGRSRRVDPGAAFDWLRQGWAFFMAAPGVWLACTVIAGVLFLALQIVPVIGGLAANLLLPLLVTGFMILCRRLSAGETPEIGDLFSPFRSARAGNVVILGVIYAAVMIGIIVVAGLVVAGGVASGVIGGAMSSSRQAGIGFGLGMFLGSMLLSMLLILVLATPLILAMWFSPLLVYFHAMPPVEAMKASFHACVNNWLPFLVHGLILSVLAFFALLPVGLGLLVLVPVIMGGLYASYRDLFPAA